MSKKEEKPGIDVTKTVAWQTFCVIAIEWFIVVASNNRLHECDQAQHPRTNNGMAKRHWRRVRNTAVSKECNDGENLICSVAT